MLVDICSNPIYTGLLDRSSADNYGVGRLKWGMVKHCRKKMRLHMVIRLHHDLNAYRGSCQNEAYEP